MEMSRRVAMAGLAFYLATLFWLTLGGFYQARPSINLVPFWMIRHDIEEGGRKFLVNFVGNLVVTLPVGWFLAFLLGSRCSAFKVGLASFLLSLLIEVLQGISGRRVADVDDFILNTIGGLIGYILWRGAERGIGRFRALSRFATKKRLSSDP